MKVIFLEDIPDVAMAGQVKEVKPGYARNFLLPKGLAALATADQLQRQKKLLAAAEQRHQDLLSEAQQQAEKLEGLALTVVARVGERGKLYGSVTSAEVCAKVQEATGLEIDRHKVLLGQPIKELGTFPVAIRLAPEVKVTVNVNVIGEAPKEAAVAAGTAKAPEAASAAVEEAPAAEAEGAKEPPAAQE